MTVSVAFDGVVIDTADTAANWTAIKITSGGQAPTAVAADAAYEGSNNVTCRSDNKRVFMYTDVGAGNEVDFTSGSTGSGSVKAPGEMFYIWANFLPSPLLALQSEGGLGIFMSTNAPGSSNYALWYFHGRDTYTGGWVRLAIDPNKTPSIDTDSFDPGNVRYFGAFAHNNQGAAKYDNFVVDQCARGRGLIVTGTSTLGLAEELVADEETNRHGVFTSLNDSNTSTELLGFLTLGDDSGVLATTITDEDSKIFLAEPRYYETTLQASCPASLMGLGMVGNTTGATSVIFGQQVGSDKGRNGITIVGNPTYDFSLDFDDGNVDAAETYGCTFETLTGAISWGTNTAHKCFSTTFNACSQVDPVGGVQTKNITLSNYVGADGALLWNNSIDITGQFINVDRGVEVTQTTTQSFNELTFDDEAGNYDVHLNNGGVSITINKTGGSNPNSYIATGGGTVTFSATFTATLTGLEDTTRVVIVNQSTRVVLSDQTSTVSGTLAYNHAGGEVVDIMCYHNDFDVYNITELTLDNADQGILIAQDSDLFYSNP